MKVSLNLAQYYSNVDLKSIPREELLQRIGAQLGAVEDVVDWAPKFEGAVIVKVVSCEKHPNADKLSICQIDDGGKNQAVERGEDGLIQVVCGAPNVHAGMFAVWLAPGVTVPSSRDKDPFVLEARDIRGQVSNGMMASAHELGISDDHSGIVEITETEVGQSQPMPSPGSPLTELFGLDDFVIDCENKMFTHRPDCFGNLGVARELAGISGLKFESPDWYLNPPQFELKEDLHLEVKNDAPELVPRFMAVAMSGITVKPSPMWLQATLARVGIKPINNVVDVTNYIMHLTGQPLHAFDYDKIKERSDKPGIFPRMSQKGEKLTLLGQKEIELTGEEIVISTDKQAVALAGVMGGAETEVNENTKNIIIECATFDMYSIRRTSMRYGLFTDAVTRFNKGQSPLQNNVVLAYAMKNMTRFAGAEQASNVFDQHSGLTPRPVVTVSSKFVSERLGVQLSGQKIADLLKNTEFDLVDQPTEVGETLDIGAPFWRMDIEIPEDIVEEVGRLYGYDKLPVVLPKRTAKPTPKNKLFDFKQHVRFQLKEAGANEVLTYSFVHGDLMKKVGVNADEQAYHLRNAISPDLQYYRTSLVPSLLSKVRSNIKAQAGSTNNQFALFEIGKIHIKNTIGEEDLPLEFQNVALVVTADDKTAKAHQSGAAYYLVKKYIDWITGGQAEYVPLTSYEHPVYSHYEPNRSAGVIIDGDKVGVIGELNGKVRKTLKLPEFTAAFEIELEQMMLRLMPAVYKPLPPLPGTSQDYTKEVPADMPWQQVRDAFEESLQQVAEGYVYDIEPRDIFAPEGHDLKRVTFRVNFSHPDKTMTTGEATRLLVAAADKIHELLPN